MIVAVHHPAYSLDNFTSGSIIIKDNLENAFSGLSNLQCMQQEPDDRLEVPIDLPSNNLTLENYCDNRHGFLRVEVKSYILKEEYYTVPRPQESWSAPSQRIDNFEIDLKEHKLTKSTISR